MRRAFLPLVLLAFSAASVGAITNGVAPSEADTRYDAVGAFAVSWRLGLDQGAHSDDADHAWFCSATLVNAQQIIVAKHCLSTYGTGSGATYMVRFRRAEDGSLGSVAAGVASFFHARVATSSWWQHPTVDLAIGTLEDPVYHITPIPLSDESLSVGQAILHAGWGKEGATYGSGTATRLMLCANTIGAIDSEFITHPTPYIPPLNACGPNAWDSGAPTIKHDACGNPRIVGLTIFAQAATRVTTSATEIAPPDTFYRCDLAPGPSPAPMTLSRELLSPAKRARKLCR